MRSIYILVAAFLITTLGNAQELILKAQTTNPTSEINDGSITVTVSGGKAPYTYKWSNQSTPLKSNTATSLTEGINYTVEVTDADGNNVAGVYEVKAEV